MKSSNTCQLSGSLCPSILQFHACSNRMCFFTSGQKNNGAYFLTWTELNESKMTRHCKLQVQKKKQKQKTITEAEGIVSRDANSRT